MKLANDVRSLWSGVKVILAGSDRTTVVICPTAKLPAEPTAWNRVRAGPS